MKSLVRTYIPKQKRLPNTKKQDRFVRSHKVPKVTRVSKNEFGVKKIIIHIARTIFVESLILGGEMDSFRVNCQGEKGYR